MRILKYILFAIVLMGTEQITLSQYYLKVKSNTTSLESDSALIFVNGYRGTINWQASSDLMNWVSLNRHKDTLGVRIDSSAYYRAAIVAENCNPVMSDTAFLIEKLTITGSDQFTVDIQGGVFLLPSGIKVKIPVGAVSGPKEIKVDIIGFDDANALAPVSNSENASFLSGISIATDQFDFIKPIKIKIHLLNIDVTGLPLLYKLDTLTSSWVFSNETFVVNPQQKFVEIILKGSDQKGNLTKELSQDDLAFMKQLIIFKYTGIWLDEDPCRWGGWTNNSMDYEYQHSGGCSVSQIENKIVYHDCGSKEESYSATEIAPSCVPQLTGLPEGCITIKKGETTHIELSTSIGGIPLPNQTIDLGKSSNLSAPDNLITLSDGSITLDVTGNEIGDGSISLSVPFDYYLSTIKASGGGINEYNPYNQVVSDPPLNYQVCVTVVDVPKVSTASATDINCTSATVGGNIISDNNSEITDRGILFMGEIIPAGSGPGSFSTPLTNLEYNTIYSVKAYAANEVGMGYGDLVYFTTLDADECDVKFKVSTNIPIILSSTDATLGGKVTSDGNSTVTERGIYWGTSPDPQLTGTKLVIGSGPGSFSTNLSGLSPDETYYVIAYAINTDGPSYGIQKTFTTQPTILFRIWDATSWTPENHYLSTVTGAIAKLYASQSSFVNNLPEYTATSDANGIVTFYVPIQEKYIFIAEKGDLSNIVDGYVIVGIYNNQAELDSWHGIQPGAYVGGPRYKDWNGDALINQLDRLGYDIIYVHAPDTTTFGVIIGK